jgi:hypothetical protein
MARTRVRMVTGGLWSGARRKPPKGIARSDDASSAK